MVQLCIPRNKQRLSSKRYKGAANIKYQKARKGFNLKFNPDIKWSHSLYKCLDKLQKDRQHILLLNRDDQAGFRLDSTYTHKSAPSLNVGNPSLTTHTDFLNKHPTQLQTISYNFSSTSTTSEICCGVVKASAVHEKSPSQHHADLTMLQKVPELAPIFNKQDGNVKDIECIWVDGGADEGPSHPEVQFLWTERHFHHCTRVTLVTTRSSGDSFLNRVELQNGCLARGHSNLFIPSTICGEPYNDAGDFDETRQKHGGSIATIHSEGRRNTVHEDYHIIIQRSYWSRCDKTKKQTAYFSKRVGQKQREAKERRPRNVQILQQSVESLQQSYGLFSSNQICFFSEMLWKIRLSSSTLFRYKIAWLYIKSYVSD